MAFTLDAMSIYGQDTRILESWYKQQECRPPLAPYLSPQEVPPPKPPSRCFFLELPLELRQQIYQYILPKTYEHSNRGIVWMRGNTSLLAVNPQLHDEVCPFIYSTNVFAIDVGYDCSTFACQWLSPKGLLPKRRLAFPEQIGERYLKLIRRMNIFVHHIDQYTGMIKYNYGGSALTDGLRDQVHFLCQCLSRLPNVQILNINLKDDRNWSGVSQYVLEPFLQVKNVRTGTVAGNVEAVFRDKLSHHLNTRQKLTTYADLPAEIRQQIYKYLSEIDLVPSRGIKAEKVTRHSDCKTLCALVALAKTNHANYHEIQTYIFNHFHIRLNIRDDLTYDLRPCSHFMDDKKWHRTRPVSLFPKDIYSPGFSTLTSLVIHVEFMVVSHDSPEFTILKKFFDKLVVLLQSAPLRSLKINYLAPTKTSSSSNDSSTGDQIGIQLQPPSVMQDLARPSDDRNETAADASFTAVLTTSPSSTAPMLQAQQTLLRTPPILYLIAKLNPIMAKIKTQEHGSVGIHRHHGKPSGKNSKEDELDFSPLSPSSASEHLNYQRPWNNARPSTAGTEISRTATLAHGTETSSSRSSSLRRSTRKGEILFPDVPV